MELLGKNLQVQDSFFFSSCFVVFAMSSISTSPLTLAGQNQDNVFNTVTLANLYTPAGEAMRLGAASDSDSARLLTVFSMSASINIDLADVSST